MKFIKRLLLLALLLLLVAVFYNYPKLNIISGYAAKNMASSVFVAERSIESVTQNDNNVPLIELADTEVNPDNNVASASVFGLMTREAVYRKGLGCVLINDDYDPNEVPPSPKRAFATNTLAFPYGDGEPRDSIFENVNYGLLQKTMDSAFARPATQKTRSVLVVYKDHILAERYANEISKETPVLGWSMTKSVLATLFGILEYQEKIDIATYRPFVPPIRLSKNSKDP
ncbi:MAG: serine hydrolase, partial [Flavobacteriaceae bacterium]